MRTITICHIERFRGFWGVLALIGGGLLGGCSQLTDPSTPVKTAESSVVPYYMNLQTKGAQYQYVLKSQNAFLPLSDTLHMDMQGKDVSTVNGLPVYWCNWSYAVTPGQPVGWFYALTDSEAVALGTEWNGVYTDSWVDLKAPLRDTASWSFTSQGEQITASIKQFKVSVSLNGKAFDNVIVVGYVGSAGTHGTNWFAPGIGTIYSHIERPGNEMVDLQFQKTSE
jgi:hypothetical protein